MKRTRSPARGILLHARFLIATLTLLAACSAPTWREPEPLEGVAFLERAETRTAGELTVTVAVPTREETKRIFGTSLYAERIQPVWIQVENAGEVPRILLKVGLDPDYFSPLETAHRRHSGSAERRFEMDRFFYSMSFHNPIPPGSVTSGFVFTNLDEGHKAVNVDLLGDQSITSLSFVVEVPTIRTDSSAVDFDSIYETVTELSTEEELRAMLEALPSCTTNESGDREGDPLNVVLIGDRRYIFSALIRRGWHQTERTYFRSAVKTVWSFLFGSRYHYSPVSALYVFGRAQDVAMQKARDSIHHRNHMRFWRAPYDYRGQEIYIGQISRDIGVKFSWRTVTTHAIDPDVDDTRGNLIEDMAYSQAVSQVGWVKGSRVSTLEDTHTNLTPDPYYSDGLRAVLFFEERPHALTDIRILDWERSRAAELLIQHQQGEDGEDR